jgi:hypothetical protein
MNVWTPLAWPIPHDSSLYLFLHVDGLADALVDTPIRFLALYVTAARVSASAASHDRLQTLVACGAGRGIICVLVRELHIRFRVELLRGRRGGNVSHVHANMAVFSVHALVDTLVGPEEGEFIEHIAKKGRAVHQVGFPMAAISMRRGGFW